MKMNNNNEEIISFKNTEGHKRKRIKWIVIYSLLSLLLVITGLLVSFFLTKEKTNVEQQAATSSGVAKVYITPESKTLSVGETFSAKILFDSSGNYVSALTILLEYSAPSDSPAISVSEIKLNTSLATSQMWDFPIKTSAVENGKVYIKIAGFSSSISGYKTNGQEELATITFKAEKAGEVNVVFNESESKITSKDNGNDILLIPQSEGNYIVSGGNISETPEPTPTPDPYEEETPIPTRPPVPETGINTPFVLGVTTGSLLLFLSLALMF